MRTLLDPVNAATALTIRDPDLDMAEALLITARPKQPAPVSADCGRCGFPVDAHGDCSFCGQHNQ